MTRISGFDANFRFRRIFPISTYFSDFDVFFRSPPFSNSSRLIIPETVRLRLHYATGWLHNVFVVMKRDIFQAIADPTRRAIIALVAVQAMTPNGLAEHFDTTRQAVSK